MKSEYFKNLTKQEIYDITDGLNVGLHWISLKRLDLDWNILDTDISNEIFEKIGECIDNLHEELYESLEEYRNKNKKHNINKKHD